MCIRDSAGAVRFGHVETDGVHQIAPEIGPGPAHVGPRLMHGAAPVRAVKTAVTVVAAQQHRFAAQNFGMAGQTFFGSQAQVGGQSGQIAGAQHNASPTVAAMAAATAGKQLWGEQTLVLGLEATILHHGDARATQHFARFGAAYALLHPEQQGRAGQGQGFAGVVGAIVGGPEQAHYIRLESQPRQVAQAGGGGHAPHCFAYRVDRKDAVTGGHEITSHPIHGRAGLVLGAQDGDGRGPAQQVAQGIVKQHVHTLAGDRRGRDARRQHRRANFVAPSTPGAVGVQGRTEEK